MEADINNHIEFRTKRGGRERPFIRGTRVEVQYIVTDSEIHNMDPEEIARGYDNVSIAQVYAALAFYHQNREEVRRMIREDEQLVEQHRKADQGVTGQGRHDATSVSP